MRACLCFAAGLLIACGPSVIDPAEVITSIEIQPANATLTVTDAPVTLAYVAIGHFQDGHTAPLPDAVFTLDGDGSRLGAFDGAEFEAGGQAAGKGGVFAMVGDQVASTSVMVNVHPTRLGPGVPSDGASKFPDTPPTGASSPTIVYPLDGAVMPTSVKAPNVQWEGPAVANDLYRVRIVAGNATVDTILLNAPSFTFSSQLAPADWQLLVNSMGTGALTVTVDHWNPTSGASGGAPVGVRLIGAEISGAIYYWNLGEGKMERIDASGRSVAIPNAMPKPIDPNQGTRCIACHTVSKDGRYLSGSMWGGGEQGAIYDMSNPLVRTADPAPTVSPLTTSSYTQLFSTFNPTATRLLVNIGQRFELRDPATGALVPSTGLPGSRVAHPSWSPDGAHIAFVNNIANGADTGTWAVDYTYGDLQVMPANAGDSFGAPTTLVAGSANASFPAASWPSFSPDSTWIAYGGGMNSRGEDTTVPARYPGALFVVNRAGGPTRILDVACAGGRDCHLPNFSPYDAGGYFWLVFYSFRDYGNAQAGTKGTARRQLWVTAIDKTKLMNGTGDPSSVAYWLPDQDTKTANMSAYWALPAPIQ